MRPSALLAQALGPGGPDLALQLVPVDGIEEKVLGSDRQNRICDHGRETAALAPVGQPWIVEIGKQKHRSREVAML